MTTTAFDDQFAPEPVEPVRERYDTATILRRNIADLEIALKQQTDRAEAAEAELLAVRDDNHQMMLEIDGLRKELAATAPNVPTDEQIHAAYRNALGQSIRERDMPEIRKFARALLQSAAVKESLTAAPDCRTCANRGQVNGLSQESYCDSCIYQGRDWRKNHFVDASKTADAVKRRCDACAVLPCSCK